MFIADWWSGSEVRIFAKPEVLADLSGQSAIVVMNHHIELDWCYGWMVADRFGLLGNARVFVKKMLKYVPIVGWAWNFSDVAYLERNWDKDQEAMTKSVTSLSHYPDPVWLLVFAEGTRLSPEKLEASREFARKRGLPVLRHCKCNIKEILIQTILKPLVIRFNSQNQGFRPCPAKCRQKQGQIRL